MNIVLGVTGGIAAYKTPDLVRRLRDTGAAVRVIMTPNAARFVSPLALSAVSDHPVIVEQWGDPGRGGVDHIEIARWCDLLLIAPATANSIAKLAAGIADDALTTYAVAHRGDVIVAPAMNSFMYRHATVRSNLEILRGRGVVILDPDSGLLACGDEGVGRMPDPHEIAGFIARRSGERDLDGRHVVVTAGPTREPIDPVRYLTNRSSGKMGYALAEAAKRRGASVTLISGPTAIDVPTVDRFVRVETAAEMKRAVLEALPGADLLIKAAAVADYAAATVADAKMKKGSDSLQLDLRRTDDILEAVAGADHRAVIVAFAAETNDIAANARAKMERKRADFVVANDVGDRSIGFDSDENEVVVHSADGSETPIAKASKLTVAHAILDVVGPRLRGESK